MKADHEIVLAAVKQYGGALQDASQEMKGDRGTVLAALQQDGSALEYASLEVRNRENIILAAIGTYLKEHPSRKGDLSRIHYWIGWEHVPERMKQNQRVRDALGI